MKHYAYTLNIDPAEEGGFVVTVPALSGCHTQGETYDEAVAMAHECIEGFLEALVKAGQPIPREAEPTRRLKQVAVVKAPVAA